MKRKLPIILLVIFFAQQVSAQCNASFTAAVNNQQAAFTATAASSTLYHTWMFGDGAYPYFSGIDPTASHTYNNPGSYTVLHLVKDTITNCTDSSWQQVNIQFDPACHAAFSVFLMQRFTWGNKYVFVNNSTHSGGDATYTWKINGEPAGPSYNAYYPATQFRVCLTVTTSGGCSSETCQDVTMPSLQQCNQQLWIISTASPANPQLVKFTSQPVISSSGYLWDFGDGYSSTEIAPSHLYGGPGTYLATLFVHDTLANCIDSVVKSIYIPAVIQDSCTTSFTYTTNSAGVTQFFPSANSHVKSYSWWIDSTHFTNQSPSYSFTDTIPHLVCLDITTDSGCPAHYCQNVIMSDSASRSINGQRLTAFPNPSSGNEIHVNIGLKKAANIVYKIYSAGGLPVATGQQRGLQGNNNVRIPVSTLRPGQYFVEFIYNDQRKRSIFIKL